MQNFWKEKKSYSYQDSKAKVLEYLENDYIELYMFEPLLICGWSNWLVHL